MIKKKTNLEKWNLLQTQYKQELTEFIQKNKIEIPQAIYQVLENEEVEERIVLSYYYFGDDWRAHYYQGKKPKNREIENFRKIIENPIFFADKIRVKWVIIKDLGKVIKGSISLKEINDSQYIFLSKEEAEIWAESRRKEKEEERSLLDTKDYIRCAYCRKVFPKKEAIERTIINIKMYGYQGKKFKYCSAKCGFSDQCAHEG